MRLLLVEDEEHVAVLLRESLEEAGHVVDVASDGVSGLDRATATDYDGIVLDVMIPKPDGIEVTTELRSRGRWTPILLLTAKGEVADLVRGLDAGADDYLAKPFDLDEFLARVRALTRRAPSERLTRLRVGDLLLDVDAAEAWRNDQRIDLTPKERGLLEFLMRNAGKAMTRRQILDAVWGTGYLETANLVEVYIGYLRDKIDRPFGLADIETVRGVGYRLRKPDAAPTIATPSATER